MASVSSDAREGMTPDEMHNIFRAEPELWWYRGMRAISAGLLGTALASDAKSGLDAGCGTGFNALDFERRYGLRMYGVDLVPLGVAYCRKRDFARSAVASITDLPFPANCFDVVSSIDVICHVWERDTQVLQEFLRVLRPGGWLVIRVPAFRILRSRHSQYVSEGHRYRAPELLGKLAALGCPAVRWSYANFFLSPVAFLKFRVWENLVNAPAQSGVAVAMPSWLNRTLESILKLEAALIRHGLRFPFGQSLMVLAQKPPKDAPPGGRSR